MLVIKSELGNTDVCLGAPGLRGNIVKHHCPLGKQSRRERDEGRARWSSGINCMLLSFGQISDNISLKPLHLVPAAGTKKTVRCAHTVWAWGRAALWPCVGIITWSADGTQGRWLYKGQNGNPKRLSFHWQPARQSRIWFSLERWWIPWYELSSTGQQFF